MKQQGPTPIVLDTSILLNFVKIGRVELLGQLGTSVVLLDQVLDEVIRSDQRKAVKGAVAAGTLDLQSVRNPVEVALFTELRAGDDSAFDHQLGLDAKKAGCHNTRSASLPVSTEPI